MGSFLLLAESDWSTQTIAVLTAAMTVIGAAATFIVTKGLDGYIRLREWRLSEKARLAQMRAAESKPFSTDQMWEDKTLAMGYKALMYSQEKRIQDLDNEVDRIKKEHLTCIQDKADTDAKLNVSNRRVSKLERQLRILSQTTHTNLEYLEDDDDDATTSETKPKP